jgi:hypothetical protein
MALVQLDPPLPLVTPRGNGLAYAVIDYGIDFDLIWVIAMDETGQVWCVRNPEVRMGQNITQGRIKPEKPDARSEAGAQ